VAKTIRDLLQRNLRECPDSAATISGDGFTLSYADLIQQIQTTVAQLRGRGLERNDRVAVVLPNGPDMAVAFLAIASACACAPLNPAYRAEEFEFYLSDLAAKALVILHGFESPSRNVAAARRIPVLELLRDEYRGGAFNLANASAGEVNVEFAASADTALVLHTSGTTSRPKLVPLTHANLTASAEHIRMTLQLTPADRCLNIMPLFHIHGLVGALLASIAAGGSVVCTGGFDAPRFFDWLSEFRPTWFTAVPTMHRAILDRSRANTEVIRQVRQGRLRLIRSSSSTLLPQLASEMEGVFGVPVIDTYGMTEAAHQMTSNPLPPARRKPGSVGLAAGPDVAIMDEDGNLLLHDAIGEVVIRGENVTVGYDGNSEANRRAYQNGWFRTGDQGYLDSDGYLFLTGRLKEIINRGGEKISPREIDEVLIEHPSVAEALTFALPDDRLGEDVAAAVVLRADRSASEMELKEYAAARLADFKTPCRIVILDEIPKGPTGKPQRLGLAERLGLASRKPSTSTSIVSVASPTETEVWLCDLWRRILRVEQVGVHDDFFQLGGDSILATQFLARLRDRTAKELKFFVFFSDPTVAAVARWLEEVRNSNTFSALQIIASRSSHQQNRASPSQEAMFFVQQFHEAKHLLNRPVLFRIRGTLNLEALKQAFNGILRRHEVLRTRYVPSDGRLIAEVFPIDSLEIPFIDLTDLPFPSRELQAMHILRTEASRPFILSEDVMLRAVVIRLDMLEHYIFVNMHHIASDGWSSAIVMRELDVLYAAYCGHASLLPPQPSIQFADFAAWQHERLRRPIAQEQISYWKNKLAGSPDLLDLPSDRPRPAVGTYNGGKESILIPTGLVRSLKDLSRNEGVTLYMTALAAFTTLLHRYTGMTDIVLGSMFAGRTRRETEDVIGLFMNTVALRTDMSGEPTFVELLKRVRSVVLEAHTHQELPFEKVIETINPHRRRDITPLFQVCFQFRNYPETVTKLHDLILEAIELDSGVAPFDLLIEIEEVADGVRCLAIYSTDLFDATTIQRMLGHYRNILEAVAAVPNQSITTLPVLTPRERRTMLEDWNQTAHVWPEACFPQLFEQRVGRAPQGTAVVFEGVEISFRELNERANRVAHHLRRCGVGPEVIVALLFERSIEMLVGIIAILKAGGAYLPLDPEYPSDRLDAILANARPAVVLSCEKFHDRLAAFGVRMLRLDADYSRFSAESAENPVCTSKSGDAAYILYTSGSTGEPKGVVVEHKALSNYIWSFNHMFSIGETDRSLQISSYCFDVSVAEIFPTLAFGAAIILAKPGGQSDPHYIAKLVTQCAVTIVNVVPSMLGILVDQPAFCTAASLRVVLSGGETLPVTVHDRFLERSKAELYNMYGPTETTVEVTGWRCRRELTGTRVPIGRPLPNCQVFVLDKNLEPLPIGVSGELYIGGAGVARGYLNAPEITREKFIPSPFASEAGARLYKTGDVARFSDTGDLDFLGRRDRQVKLRGFRIELNEIEIVLRQHPHVKDAVVLLRQVNGSESLVAYFVPNELGSADARLRTFLRQKLPDYMVPAHFVQLEDVPLSSNGKIDYRALPEPALRLSDRSHAGPRDSLEAELVQVWESVLGVKPVGITDNFFELGGHSLMAIHLFAEVEKVFGKALPLATLFEALTIDKLAQVIRDETFSPQWSSLVPVQTSGSKPPLFCIHAAGGNVLFYAHLARHLGPEQPFYALQARGLDGKGDPLTTIEEMAACYINEIKTVQRQGPYYLGGFCSGAYVALEIANQLRQEGREVGLLAVFATDGHWKRLRSAKDGIRYHLRNLRQLSFKRRTEYLLSRVAYRANRIAGTLAEAISRTYSLAGASMPVRLRSFQVEQVIRGAADAYSPPPYSGKVIYFQPYEDRFRDAKPFWCDLVGADLEIRTVPGNGETIFHEPNVQELTHSLKTYLP
jgi:amino acid adenylation domain-containing protein